MSFEIEGKLHKLYDTEVKGESFRVREFVIETQDQYPQFVKFQLTQDRCDLMNNYTEGAMIKVSFDLRGREWNGKYFTNLNAWRIASAESEDQGSPFGDVEFADPMPGASDEGGMKAEDFTDDLPF